MQISLFELTTILCVTQNCDHFSYVLLKVLLTGFT